MCKVVRWRACVSAGRPNLDVCLCACVCACVCACLLSLTLCSSPIIINRYCADRYPTVVEAARLILELSRALVSAPASTGIDAVVDTFHRRRMQFGGRQYVCSVFCGVLFSLTTTITTATTAKNNNNDDSAVL